MIWKDVKSWEGFYQISNRGDVRSLDRIVNSRYSTAIKRGKVLKKYTDSHGYDVVHFTNKKRKKLYKVHRLVGKAYAKGYDINKEINHIDGIKTNNNMHNLEWVTRKENIIHAHKLGLSKPPPERPKHPVKQLTMEGEVIAVYKSQLDAQKATGIHNSNIAEATKANRKSAGGYRWERI